MKLSHILRHGILYELILLLLLSPFCFFKYRAALSVHTTATKATESPNKNFIKWVEFKVPYSLLDAAYTVDVESHDKKIPLHWIELLAYLAAKNGGNFTSDSEKELNKVSKQLSEGKTTIDALTKDLKYYPYFLQSYSAVLGGFVGDYQIEIPDKKRPGKKIWTKKYGLKCFSPIAKNYPYSDFDDFGVSRSYGYKRRHLGHDMMGQVGTPIVAVESGYVEAIGWNQYGGWRLGIRSFDKKRYYYYAHLRRNFPYNKSLKEGSIVQAGDVIGYLGRTGYSAKENVNNIDSPHLHFGLQLIFDESQKECNNEIWIDCYNLIRFLYKNRSETLKNQKTKEYHRIYGFKDPTAAVYKKEFLKKASPAP